MENIVDLTDVDKSGDEMCITYDITDSDIELAVPSFEESAIQVMINQFITLCTDLENSKGMSEILKEIFMSQYKTADAQFKNSIKFKRALKRAIKLLKYEPQHMFSHINDLCNIMKTNNTKHIMLNDKTGCKVTRKRKRKTSPILTTSQVILIDDTEDISQSQNVEKISDISISDIEMEKQIGYNHNINEDTQCGVDNIENIDTKHLHKDAKCEINKNVSISYTIDDNREIHKNNNSANENGISFLQNGLKNGKRFSLTKGFIENKNVIEFSQTNSTNENQQLQVNKNYDTSCFDVNKENQNENVYCYERESDKYLVPQMSIEYNDHKNNIDIKRIIALETHIARYHQIINRLEEEEVTTYNEASEYLQSEKFKAKIVLLYKELCKLTGNQPFKRNRIRLKNLEGHPVGPLKRLERFINLKSDSVLYFPDFEDVITCVTLSNIEDKLGWSKSEVRAEARVLFKQCGRMLQKLRKKREWRFLLDRVKNDEFENDPADRDPELRARLDANRRDAAKKEVVILNRYTLMQERTKRSEKPSNVLRINPVRLRTDVATNEPTSKTNQELDNASDKNMMPAINNEEHKNINKSRCDINGGIQTADTKDVILDEEMDTNLTERIIYKQNNQIKFNNNMINSTENENVNNKNTEESILKQINELGDNCKITVTEICD